MISRIGVAVMGAALLLYVGGLAWLAVMFIASGTPVGIAMGIGLAVLAPLGGWALVRELVFGFQADRLGRTLEAEGGMPDEEVGLTPSGRVVKEEAEPLVARYEAAAASDITSYRDTLAEYYRPYNRPHDWISIAVHRVADVEGLDGRETMREAFAERGLPSH